jgi:hypothetical protein
MITKTTAFPYIAILGRLPLVHSRTHHSRNENSRITSTHVSSGATFTSDTSNIDSGIGDVDFNKPTLETSRSVDDPAAISPHHYCDIKRYHEAEEISGFCIIRMDASLYFANCAYFKSFILHHIQITTRTIHTLVIDASAWIDIDLMGIQTLFELKEEVAQKYGIKLVLASVKGGLRDRLKSKKYEECGSGNNQLVYMTIDDALAQRKPRLSIGSYEEHQRLLSDDLESQQLPHHQPHHQQQPEVDEIPKQQMSLSSKGSDVMNPMVELSSTSANSLNSNGRQRSVNNKYSLIRERLAS